eukprot:COSAG05_NODE_3984_length_1738_cov_2.549725_2_plen_363_part_01
MEVAKEALDLLAQLTRAPWLVLGGSNTELVVNLLVSLCRLGAVPLWSALQNAVWKDGLIQMQSGAALGSKTLVRPVFAVLLGQLAEHSSCARQIEESCEINEAGGLSWGASADRKAKVFRYFARQSYVFLVAHPFVFQEFTTTLVKVAAHVNRLVYLLTRESAAVLPPALVAAQEAVLKMLESYGQALPANAAGVSALEQLAELLGCAEGTGSPVTSAADPGFCHCLREALPQLFRWPVAQNVGARRAVMQLARGLVYRFALTRNSLPVDPQWSAAAGGSGRGNNRANLAIDFGSICTALEQWAIALSPGHQTALLHLLLELLLAPLGSAVSSAGPALAVSLWARILRNSSAPLAIAHAQTLG